MVRRLLEDRADSCRLRADVVRMLREVGSLNCFCSSNDPVARATSDIGREVSSLAEPNASIGPRPDEGHENDHARIGVPVPLSRKKVSQRVEHEGGPARARQRRRRLQHVRV